jgi:hypothetical protein
MINLFKSRTQKTSNAQTHELSFDDLASVAGGLTAPSSSGGTQCTGFVLSRVPGHPDPRAM